MLDWEFHGYSCPRSNFPIWPQESGTPGVDLWFSALSSDRLVATGQVALLISSKAPHILSVTTWIDPQGVHMVRNMPLGLLGDCIILQSHALHGKQTGILHQSVLGVSEKVSSTAPSPLLILLKYTYQVYAFLKCFYIPCIEYVIEGLKPNMVHHSQCYWVRERFIKKGVQENKSLGPHYNSCLYSRSCIAS